MNTKINIVSGFLGAGKTTFIKKMLQEKAYGKSPVLIENDFGSLGIDSSILESTGIQITELNSGCICCTLIGNFTIALKKLLTEFQAEHVIIEPSGVGLLSEIKPAVEVLFPEFPGLSMDKVVTIVDVKRFDHNEKYVKQYYEDQIQTADVIVLSKTAGVSGEQILKICERIKEIKPELEIISQSWDNPFKALIYGGEDAIIEQADEKVDSSAVHSEVGVNGEGRVAGKVEVSIHEEEEEEHHHHHHEHGEDCTCGCHDHDHHHGEEEEHHHHEHDHEHHSHDHELEHHHDAGIFEYCSFDIRGEYTKAQLDKITEELGDQDKYGSVVRAKGIIYCDGEIKLYDYVPGEGGLSDINTENTGRFLVIGVNLNRDNLFDLFACR